MRLTTVLLTVAVAGSADAGRRGRFSPRWQYQQQTTVQRTFQPAAVPMQASQVQTTVTTTLTVNGSDDALDEVNAQRARRGLRPFLKDRNLTIGALNCARFRAARFIHGHIGGPMGDFAHLPPGTSASAGGCGALEPSWGFAACCVYDDYQYAGAAWVMGSDGRRYNHIFVR